MKNEYILNIVAMLISLFLITNIQAQTYVPGKLYVKVNDPLGIPKIEEKSGQVFIELQNNTIKNIFESYGVYKFYRSFPDIEKLKVKNTYGLERVYTLKCLGDQEDLMDAIIANQTGVYEYIEQVPEYQNMYEPNDYHLLDNDYGSDSALNLMNAKAAWDITKGDSSIKLGMHEKGLPDTMHIDLINKVKLYDTVVTQYESHGTFVAGCLAGETDNNSGKSAMGYKCNIHYQQYNGEYETDWMRLVNSGVHVISVSYSAPGDPITTIQDLINLTTDMGILTVAAAGNGWYGTHPPSDYQYPSSYANVLSVTSVDNTKHHYVTYPSSHPVHTHNDSVDVSAPGRHVIGLAPGSNYAKSSGTSYAAPYVAGIAGLIYSINPCLTPQEVTQIIKSTTENIDAQNPDYIGLIGTGLVDASAAVSLTDQKYGYKSYTISNSQNISWDSLMYCSMVTIESGGTLQINTGAEIIMADTAKIIVEPGGELLIWDGEITKNNCSDFWKGIEVRGNGSLMQATQYQGAIRIDDDAIIEYAECGVRAYGMNNGIPIPNSGGGIILATGGRFINNKTAIKINDYVYVNGLGYPQNNESVIIGSRFEITDDYFFHTDDDPVGVHLSSVGLVGLSGNTFENTTSGLTGIGTYISNADALIKDNLVPNTYIGWDYGIKALGMRNSNTISIEDNVFESCNTGVYLSGITNANLLFNQFEMNRFQTGLYLDNCHEFIVEENGFSSHYSPISGTPSYGLVINNSGAYDNEVYLNSFDQVKYAVLAENCNRGNNNEGLTFKCNTFTDNGFDISVTADNGVSNPGIAAIQGSGVDAPDAPASNIFSWRGPDGAFTDMNNEELLYTYFYHDGESEHLQPIYFTESTIDDNPNSLAEWNEENSCPSRQDSGGSGGGIEEIRGAMVAAEEESTILTNNLMSLKDAGDTPELQNEVDNSTSSQTLEIYTELINTSPYVSDTVVESAIIKEDVLNNALLRDIMVANPQSAKNNELIVAIDDRSNPMPDYMKAQILQGKSIVGAMELLESEISYFKTKREVAYKNCINWYLNDTLNPQASYDSLLLFFTSIRKF